MKYKRVRAQRAPVGHKKATWYRAFRVSTDAGTERSPD